MPVSDLAKEMKASCDGNDAIACMKFKVMSFLDMLFKKDNFQVSGGYIITVIYSI